MLTDMGETPRLVAEARRAAGLSLRELAHLADVSFTTISRIEHGDIDPTVGTLSRILAACGRRLRLDAVPAESQPPTLADLADAATQTALGERPDWTRLRGALDYLARHPDDIPPAIAARPNAQSRLMNALLAGIAEKLADDHGLHRPGWTRRAPKVRPEWGSGSPRLREQRRAHAPRQLLDRGIVIDERSLFRDPKTVNV